MKNNKPSMIKGVKRVVVKIGSNVLTEDNGLNLKSTGSISKQVSRLIDNGLEIILVSSGAMAAGATRVGLKQRPDEIPSRQAIAAIGQAGLIMEYEKAFSLYNKKVAQILLTGEDLNDRKRYLNARNTLYTLLSWKVIPIINENDTVMVEEIKFGDNDNLAAMITLLMDADILINLTDIDGLFDEDPRSNPDAKLIPVVTSINKKILNIAGNIPGPLGTGGMLSKIKAARKVTAAGIPMLISNGLKPDILKNLFAGKAKGTFFVPRGKKLKSRKCWIGYSLKSKGILVIDEGAATAILKRGTSLLPSGITKVIGDFNEGAPVEFRHTEDLILGTGLVNYSAADIRKIMGLKSNQIKERLGYKPYDDVIHRDNLVITTECAE